MFFAKKYCFYCRIYKIFTRRSCNVFVGTTSDITACHHCGRANLKKVVVLKDSEGSLTYFGTTCAAKALGYSGSDYKLRSKMERVHQEERIKFKKEIRRFYRKTWGYKAAVNWTEQLNVNPNVDKNRARLMIEKKTKEGIGETLELFSQKISMLGIKLEEIIE
ncbi:hypothetical protein [Priestia megaterium]|uniref:Uncharacterized protein n=1 Tax=Priestia megaterium TaxID=1404 RepID=A0A6M6E3D8_PRIMG|nr:hypothetical protein [Priestia megaterium]QJX80226.1 hypothetical protein FDZ14_29455 [Priestia megaterium]